MLTALVNASSESILSTRGFEDVFDRQSVECEWIGASGNRRSMRDYSGKDSRRSGNTQTCGALVTRNQQLA